jgi:MATE family multidrug resistance protein
MALAKMNGFRQIRLCRRSWVPAVIFHAAVRCTDNSTHEEKTMTLNTNEMLALGRLAGPLVLASLVFMTMSITDVVMMSWLGHTALAAGAAISDLQSIVFYMMAGIVTAVAPLVSHARGANDARTIERATRQGFWAAVLVGLPAAALVWNAALVLQQIGVDPAVTEYAAPYAHTLAFAFVPMLGVMVCHHYLSAHERTRLLLAAATLALPLNALGNYSLMFGYLGMPALGLAGAGVASAIAALAMFAFMLGCLIRDQRARGYRIFERFLTPDWPCFREILRIGLPIGILSLGEVGAALLSTVVIGVFGADALAAHAVALRCAGVIYALPLGLAHAATIRIGYFAGGGDHDAVAHSAKTALWLALLVGCAYLVIINATSGAIAQALLGTGDAVTPVIYLATLFLSVLAAYQPLLCVGTVLSGVLRGVKETRIPMMISLVSIWGIGGTTAVALIVFFDTGALALWLGLAAGAATFGLGMLGYFTRLWRKGGTLRMAMAAQA